MITPDEAFENISNVFNDFSDFCSKSGQVTESDTRCKVIDRILRECLSWSENNIVREGTVDSGYYDYSIINNRRKLLIIEAKREGLPFEVPVSLKKRRRFSLSGCLKTSEKIKESIEQVQHYCIEVGCRYAVATNGYAWVIFRAIREDIPWRKGDCIVFASAGEIKKYFIEFWNLLSQDAVLKGSLDNAFSKDLLKTRNYYRPTQYLQNPDAPLSRNSYHTQLNPFVENIFRDIGSSDQIKLLEKCYVYGKSLEIIDNDLQLVIEDSIPSFIKKDGGFETIPNYKYDKGRLGRAITDSVKNDFGTLFLLLGGIGSGKTTYIRRFFNYVGINFLSNNAFCFYVDFLIAPSSQKEAEKFLFNCVLSQLRQSYKQDNLESYENLLEIFEDRIPLLKITYKNESDFQKEEYEKTLSSKLIEWTSDIIDYTGRLLRNSRKFGKTCVLCIDNVDQLSPDYQSSLFLIAQRASRDLSSIVIVALREESYYSASIRNTFTAYNNRNFHIAAPGFSYLVKYRLEYCREVLKLPPDQIKFSLKSGVQIDTKKLSNFLAIIEHSFFSKNRNIIRFIESLSFGNMREALEMFSTFLYSGATNVDKMLNIFERSGNYFVAFHEFAKTIILGDRKYYKDSVSKVLNVFDCSQNRNSSHFTTLRLLSLLLSHHNVSNSEGRGFISLNETIDSFLDVFDNEMDLKSTMLRLSGRQLIQFDTRSSKSLDNASFIRISSAGWYYYKYLVRSFAYLDLVFQDTPFNNDQIAKNLRDKIVELDKINDSQEKILQRIHNRFDRVEQFLNYLSFEEEEEFKKFNLNQVSGTLSDRIIQSIKQQYDKEKNWISKRITENLDSREDEDLAIDNLISDFLDEISGNNLDIENQTKLEI